MALTSTSPSNRSLSGGSGGTATRSSGSSGGGVRRAYAVAPATTTAQIVVAAVTATRWRRSQGDAGILEAVAPRAPAPVVEDLAPRRVVDGRRPGDDLAEVVEVEPTLASREPPSTRGNLEHAGRRHGRGVP